MSARSIARNHARETARQQRRLSRRARVTTAAAIAVGGGALLAGPAQAATFTVTSTADAAASACDTDCTLRDAVDAANADAASDTITFAPNVTGQITLTEGELKIDSAMSIQGPGAGALSVSGDANGNGIPDAGDSRVAFMDADDVGARNDVVTISGLTMTKGFPFPNADGGAFYSFETDLRLNGVSVTNSRGDDGGGGYNESGTLSIANSTFSGNTATSGGGALYTDDDKVDPLAFSSAVTIRNSTFTQNTATGTNTGGAIYIDDETDSFLLSHSTVSSNTAGSAGGIMLFGTELSSSVIQDSTISGNTAADDAGGVYAYDYYDQGVRIENSTISGNIAGGDGTGKGGGIYRYGTDNTAPGTSADVILSSSIVADNTAPSGNDLADRATTPPPITGSFVIGNSLVEDTGSAAIVENPAGSNLFAVDPALGALANNGGPTQTQLPAGNSPVVDVGVANGLATDQRGFARTSESPKGNGLGDGTDMGAVELRVVTPTIDSGPTGTTNDKTPTFGFSGQNVATFECSIDGGAFAACTSPFTTPTLADGNHKFDVRAVSVDGITGPASTRAFTVDGGVNGAKLTGKGKQKQKGNKIKIKVKAGAKEQAKVQVSGSVKVGKKKYAVKKATKTVKANKTTTITVKPKSKNSTKKIVKALDAGKKTVANLKAKFTDNAGNKTTKKKKNIKLK